MSNESQDYLAIMLLFGPLIACGIYLKVKHSKLGRLLAVEEENERLIAAQKTEGSARRRDCGKGSSPNALTNAANLDVDVSWKAIK